MQSAIHELMIKRSMREISWESVTAGILAVGQSVEETTKEMLAHLVDEDTELISLYYGQDVLAEECRTFCSRR